jgi:hypothetical protein
MSDKPVHSIVSGSSTQSMSPDALKFIELAKKATTTPKAETDRSAAEEGRRNQHRIPVKEEK